MPGARSQEAPGGPGAERLRSWRSRPRSGSRRWPGRVRKRAWDPNPWRRKTGQRAVWSPSRRRPAGPAPVGPGSGRRQPALPGARASRAGAQISGRCSVTPRVVGLLRRGREARGRTRSQCPREPSSYPRSRLDGPEIVVPWGMLPSGRHGRSWVGASVPPTRRGTHSARGFVAVSTTAALQAPPLLNLRIRSRARSTRGWRSASAASQCSTNWP